MLIGIKQFDPAKDNFITGQLRLNIEDQIQLLMTDDPTLQASTYLIGTLNDSGQTTDQRIIDLQNSTGYYSFKDKSRGYSSVVMSTHDALILSSYETATNKSASKLTANQKGFIVEYNGSNTTASITCDGALTVNGSNVLLSGTTTSSIEDSIDKRYVTDTQLTVISNTSGTNTGDQDLTVNTTKTINTISSVSGVLTIDVATYHSLLTIALTENVTSWVFNNLPSAGSFKDIEIQLTQGSSAYSCVSPATSGKTAGGTWIVSPVALSVEVLGLRIFSDGTVQLFPSGVLL